MKQSRSDQRAGRSCAVPRFWRKNGGFLRKMGRRAPKHGPRSTCPAPRAGELAPADRHQLTGKLGAGKKCYHQRRICMDKTSNAMGNGPRATGHGHRPLVRLKTLIWDSSRIQTKPVQANQFRQTSSGKPVQANQFSEPEPRATNHAHTFTPPVGRRAGP